jgi:hypothetical protein
MSGIDPNVLPPGTSVNQPEPPGEPRLFTRAAVNNLCRDYEARIAALTEQLADKDRLIHEYQDKDVQE